MPSQAVATDAWSANRRWARKAAVVGAVALSGPSLSGTPKIRRGELSIGGSWSVCSANALPGGGDEAGGVLPQRPFAGAGWLPSPFSDRASTAPNGLFMA
ncbi:hypothetical protein [Phyllobacterium sp. K27]